MKKHCINRITNNLFMQINLTSKILHSVLIIHYKIMQKYDKFEAQQVSELDKAFIADESRQPMSEINSQLERSISTISKNMTHISQFEMDRQFQDQFFSIQRTKRVMPKRRRNIIQQDQDQQDSAVDKFKCTMTKKIIVGKGKTQNIVHKRNQSPYYLRPRQNTKYVEESSNSSSNRQLRQMVDQI